jgi:hypothetical protein
VCSRASLTKRRYEEIAAEQVETRSTEEYRRSACEDFVCGLEELTGETEDFMCVIVQ